MVNSGSGGKGGDISSSQFDILNFDAVDNPDKKSFGLVSYSGFREIVIQHLQSLTYMKPSVTVKSGDGVGTSGEADGRYTVLLSLPEAEQYRRALHVRNNLQYNIPQSYRREGNATLLSVDGGGGGGGQSSLPPCSVLWSIGDIDGVTGGRIATGRSKVLSSDLGRTAGYQSVSEEQHRAMVDSYRFLNNDLDLSEDDVTTLIRILSKNPCADRTAWWTDIRACRRRRQVPLDGNMPIHAVLNIPDEFEYTEYKILVRRVKAALVERDLAVFDAFRAFNSSHSGVLNCSELYGGLDWLGIHLKPQQVWVVNFVDVLGYGCGAPIHQR